MPEISPMLDTYYQGTSIQGTRYHRSESFLCMSSTPLYYSYVSLPTGHSVLHKIYQWVRSTWYHTLLPVCTVVPWYQVPSRTQNDAACNIYTLLPACSYRYTYRPLASVQQCTPSVSVYVYRQLQHAQRLIRHVPQPFKNAAVEAICIFYVRRCR